MHSAWSAFFSLFQNGGFGSTQRSEATAEKIGPCGRILPPPHHCPVSGPMGGRACSVRCWTRSGSAALAADWRVRATGPPCCPPPPVDAGGESQSPISSPGTPSPYIPHRLYEDTMRGSVRIFFQPAAFYPGVVKQTLVRAVKMCPILPPPPPPPEGRASIPGGPIRWRPRGQEKTVKAPLEIDVLGAQVPEQLQRQQRPHPRAGAAGRRPWSWFTAKLDINDCNLLGYTRSILF